MKMFLTWIGFGSTAVVTGDVTQIDLPGSEKSGLIDASDVLGKLKGISFRYASHRRMWSGILWYKKSLTLMLEIHRSSRRSMDR